MQIKDIIEKLSSYNLFNYLFPGYVFTSILELTTGFLPRQPELRVLDIVLVYFAGLVISRTGSLVIEETLKKFIDIGTLNTGKLLTAFKDNLKLDVIHEAMNMYRTLATASLILVFFTIMDLIINHSKVSYGLFYIIAELAITTLFIFAFRKQRQKVLECI